MSKPGMSDLEVQVLDAIPRGRDDARTSAAILDEVALVDEDPTQHKLRQIIKRLITEHGYAIGSCNDGYFIIADRHELDEYLDDLRARKRGIQKRIYALKHAFAEDDDPQHSLF